MFDQELDFAVDKVAPPAAPSRYDQALANVLRSVDGQIVLRRFLADAGVARTVFNSDALAMAFNEGQRNMGLRLFADLSRVAPDALASLLLPETNK